MDPYVYISSAALILAIIILYFVYRWLKRYSLNQLIVGLAGIISGLVAGALVSIPIHSLPEPIHTFGPMAATILLLLLAFSLAVEKQKAISAILPKPKAPSAADTSSPAGPVAGDARRSVVVDTSAIIDGRIADIAEAGFAPSILIVPRFVLAELQNIADSEDAMRRGRGRRGLEVLNRLREMVDVTVEITDEDAPDIKEVDAKLVALAQRFGCNVLTTDYNLNRVAQIQGVRVLNVNELSNAIRPVVIPGEIMNVKVVQPGKERNQGVGYLSDGTMIVVENGDKMIDQDVAVEVTRVFQTVAGKMIFAVPKPLPQAVETRPKQHPSRPSAPSTVVQPERPPALQQPLRQAARPDTAEGSIPEMSQSAVVERPKITRTGRTDQKSSPKPAHTNTGSSDSLASASPPGAPASLAPRQTSHRRSGISAIEDRLIKAIQEDDSNPA